MSFVLWKLAKSEPRVLKMIPSSESRVRFLAVLLCLSGFCALVYQMVWLREFRLIFGAATPATAAVLAVFMGGLGAGGIWFGRRSEGTSNPLRLYAILEVGIGLAALTTPWVLMGVRAVYSRTGGVVALGPVVASVLHILLSVVVLAVPCFLMGGTLPLAVKGVETDEDTQRGATGLLYGLNAIGALAGVIASTFWLLEMVGTRGTLYLAVTFNMALGAAAFFVVRNDRPRAVSAPAETPARGGKRSQVTPAPEPSRQAPSGYIYGAAFVTGFVFFLAELVWYRMSAPLLGSSTYNFGIILALALAGIGLGGLIYRAWIAPRAGTVSLGFFALVSLIQAFWLILPYALGDRVAILAFEYNQLQNLGFGGQLAGWSLTGATLVLMPSLLAGIQFPVLVGLLGSGRSDVGRQLGTAYAWNTGGAIAGSLMGGFLLIPGLSAPGCWKLAAWLTLGLGASALVMGRGRMAPRSTGLGILVCAGTLWMTLGTPGPTSVWRHSAIGYGRLEKLPDSPNGIREWIHSRRWQTRAEIEGRESSLAISAVDGYAFLVNGKADGSGVSDAPTQVMLGLVGAMLHPQPRSACVVGLGTGSSAGWLAEVPGMQRVDVIEIEPGILKFARDFFGPVNRDVLSRTNVRVILGDARETLLVQGPAYDLIVSEPSNPYRAGIASLYTREYYRAIRGRLTTNGIFSQWVQGYNIDTTAVRLIYATLASEFPHVETWLTQSSDLLFVCHLQAPSYSLDQLRRKVVTPPFDEALRRVWKTDSAEGVLSHHMASAAVAREVARLEPRVNTDDLNLLEYGFARSLAQGRSFEVSDILRVAHGMKAENPAHLQVQIDLSRVGEERMFFMAGEVDSTTVAEGASGEMSGLAGALSAYAAGNHSRVLQLWRGEARGPMPQLMLLESVSRAGRPEDARALLDSLRDKWPAEARFAAAQLAARNGSITGAVDHLKVGFTLYRKDPWVRERVAKSALILAVELGAKSAENGSVLFEQLIQPFCMALSEFSRLEALSAMSRGLSPAHQVRAIDAWGEWPPWTRSFLEFRRNAYAAAHDPRLPRAQADLDAFIAVSGLTFLETLLPQ